MNEVLLCTNNPILRKSLYAILRDEGYNVEPADHPSDAVQMVLRKSYAAIIMDSEPFGLSADDAIKIIRTILPDSLVIFVGDDQLDSDALSIEAPIDLEEFKDTVRKINALGRLSQSL